MVRSLGQRLRWFTYAQQRLGRVAPDPATALHDVGAVYSVHPTAPLSLWARSARFDSAAYVALDTGRAAVRTYGPRASVHLVHRDWLPYVNAALVTGAPLRDLALRNARVDAQAYPALRDAVLAAASTPRSPAQLRAAAGLPDQAMGSLLRAMTYEGLLLRTAPPTLRGSAFAYVRTDAWLPDGIPPVDPGDARRWLAGEYLRVYGPARTADFRWWAGSPAGSAPARDAAFAAHDTVDVGGSEQPGLLLRRQDLPAWEAVGPPPAGALDVLPKWDALTMGYAPDGRARLVSPEHQARLYSSVGDGFGAILVDGAARGAWSVRFAGSVMQVSLDLFAPLPGAVRADVEDRVDQVGALLGAARVHLLAEPPRSGGVTRRARAAT